MTAPPKYYPLSPAGVPEDLTEPSARYRGHIQTVSIGLVVFFAIYFGVLLLLLTLSLCALGGAAAGANTPRGAPFFLIKVVLGLGALVPAGFLVYSLFPRSQHSTSFEIEIFPDEHPRLFRFLECVCEEVQAPMPEHVFVNCEVNASAGSDVSVLSLIRGPERELHLGLGLVNMLNITEFKALLAHEFAHLSQHDSAEAPYVRLGMRVVGNILNRVKALEWLFMFVVQLNLKLFREMEYHADLTATSVTGSDAVPQLLYKCLWADHCMQQTISDLDRAREHGLYSTDILIHQMFAGKQLRKRRKDPTLGVLPGLPADRQETMQIFEPDEDEQAAMWDDHPSNYDRELNCKARYIRTDFDDEPLWSLFDGIPKLRKAVSVKFYRQVFKETKAIKWTEARKVQAFLEDEFAETNFNIERYGVLYHYRNLQPIGLKKLTAHSAKNRNTPADLVRSHRHVYSDEVKKFAQVHLRHLQEMQLLIAIDNRWHVPKKNRFKFRGKQMKKSSVKRLLKQVDGEIGRENEWLEEFDACVFVTYYELALWLEPTSADELSKRYRFQFVLQNLWLKLRRHEEPMNFLFEFLATQGSELDMRSFQMVISILREAYDAVDYVLDQAEIAKFPPLANMPQGKPIRKYILKGDLPSRPSRFDNSLRVKWLMKFADKYEEVRKRLDRLHYKNLGSILALQEQVGAEADRRWP